MEKKGTIIFDLDDTLFDTAKLKQDFFNTIAKSGIPAHVVRDTYLELREQSPVYDIDQHVDFLYRETGVTVSQDIVDELQNMDYAKYTTTETVALLKDLREEYTLWLLSLGKYDIQMKKLSDTGLIDYFERDNIIITEQPKENELQKLSFDGSVYFINDKINETEIVAEQFPLLSCIIVGHPEYQGSLASIRNVTEIKKIIT